MTSSLITPAPPTIIYRIEHLETEHGMWYTSEGKLEPFIFTLTEGKSRDLPMEWDERYGKDGFRWYSGCGVRELMKHWFSKKDAEELLESGYSMYRLESTQYVHEEFQTVFTREGIVNRTEIPLWEVWDINNPNDA